LDSAQKAGKLNEAAEAKEKLSQAWDTQGILLTFLRQYLRNFSIRFSKAMYPVAKELEVTQYTIAVMIHEIKGIKDLPKPSYGQMDSGFFPEGSVYAKDWDSCVAQPDQKNAAVTEDPKIGFLCVDWEKLPCIAPSEMRLDTLGPWQREQEVLRREEEQKEKQRLQEEEEQRRKQKQIEQQKKADAEIAARKARFTQTAFNPFKK